MPKTPDLPATVVEVKCKCSRMVNVRTKQAKKSVTCWNCLRKIDVHLYPGGNLSIYVEQEKAGYYKVLYQE